MSQIFESERARLVRAGENVHAAMTTLYALDLIDEAYALRNALTLMNLVEVIPDSESIPVHPITRYAQRPIGPCPCECNRGGFCGGCGHAGCGGR